jgi:hypothetical protein
MSANGAHAQESAAHPAAADEPRTRPARELAFEFTRLRVVACSPPCSCGLGAFVRKSSAAFAYSDARRRSTPTRARSSTLSPALPARADRLRYARARSFARRCARRRDRERA